MLYVKHCSFTCSESAAHILRDCILDAADFAEDSCRGTGEEIMMGHVVDEMRAIARGIERTPVSVATQAEYDRILGLAPKASSNA